MSVIDRKTLLILLMFVFLAGDLAVAQLPQLRLPFRKKSATNSSSQDLAIKDGPWLIMCTSFTGQNAEQRARALANELKQHRLKTYLYRQTFDYTGTVVGKGWHTPDPNDKDGRARPLKMKSANLSLVQEVAVLVGDFPAADDNRAQKTLKKIKFLDISSSSELTSIDRSGGSSIENGDGSSDKKSKRTVEMSKGGSLRTAFLLPNPMLPDEYFQRDQVDEFIIKLNRKVKHSLLDCPGLYSVKIASFGGLSTIDPNKINNSANELQSLQETGKSLTSNRLVEAAEKAHRITEVLRKKGIEAYEYHDRQESYVCIGSFDWVTRKTNDVVLNNPEIVLLVNKCRPEIKSYPGAPNAMVAKSIEGIPFDPEPTPILVPKANKASRISAKLKFLR